jgi:Xaa-Pro aminopeptidase
VTGRVERVRALIEAPLLVTKPVNIAYLTGLDSSNAALLIEPDRLRLFTDFRYVEKASLLGLEVTAVSRNLFAGLVEHLPARIEFEAETLSYAAWATLQVGGIDLVPRSELLEGVRAVKEPGELDAIRRATAITNECFARLAEQQFTERQERELAWWIESLMHELGAAMQRNRRERVEVTDDDVGCAAVVDQRVGAAVDGDEHRTVLAHVCA